MEAVEEPGQEGYYQPKGRTEHSSVLINKDIFVWGGYQEGLPEVHESDLKLNMISVVEVFRGGDGRWKQHRTTGTPPLGVIGCASCAIGHKIYYFGGYCNHDQCQHNSLHELSIDDFKWTVCMANSDIGPKKKNACGMVAFHQVLLVVGGAEFPPKSRQHLAQYDNGKGFMKGIICTNEHHIYALGTDEWSSPTVIGNQPPPISAFTLSKFADEKALMYGGHTQDGPLSDLRVITVIEKSVHWESLAPLGPEKPTGRKYHAATIIHSPLMGDQETLLLVVGGYDSHSHRNDSWLLSIGDGASWREVKNMPPSVVYRFRHSINTIAVSHSCVWLMAVGGYPWHLNVVTFLELKLSPPIRLWELGSVLKGDEIYQGYDVRISLKFPTHCQVQQLKSNQSQLSTKPWEISREELTLTQEVLGSGAYGEVRVAIFQELRVAAKSLHNINPSDFNISLFSREMTIAAEVRHPNLLLFIGATTQDQLLIITELMTTSLRAELDKGPISSEHIKSIAIDVSCGLHYLHMKKPEPIIHRDVSSPNVLMEPLGAGSWRAKVSDYGSANFVHRVTSRSAYRPNLYYAAPEADDPTKHSLKMDVYSFGVLLMEMCLHQPPEPTSTDRDKQARTVQWNDMADVIKKCLASSSYNRPTLAWVIMKLRDIRV